MKASFGPAGTAANIPKASPKKELVTGLNKPGSMTSRSSGGAGMSQRQLLFNRQNKEIINTGYLNTSIGTPQQQHSAS